MEGMKRLEVATGGVLEEKVFLEISLNSQENNCVQDCNFIAKRLPKG